MHGLVTVATAAGEWPWTAWSAPLPLDELVPGSGPFEVEIGFGKGRHLLRAAAAAPAQRWLGLEIAGEYYREVARKVARRGLANVVVLRGEALFALTSVLPERFASTLHVYFPDPWPKAHHLRRRLLSPASIDLLVRLLLPGGRLLFATDFLDYGAEVERLLAALPGARLTRRDGPWPGGARTNYEAKFMAAGRPIDRLELEITDEAARAPHPLGLTRLAVGAAPEARGVTVS